MEQGIPNYFLGQYKFKIFKLNIKNAIKTKLFADDDSMIPTANVQKKQKTVPASVHIEDEQDHAPAIRNDHTKKVSAGFMLTIYLNNISYLTRFN